MLGTEGLLRLDKEGLLSGSAERTASRARKTGLLPGSSQSSSQTRNREHPVGHSREGLVPGDLLSGSVLRCLFWGSAERASFRARKRGPPPRLDIQCLLSSSTQRASPQAQHRGPPLGLGRLGLPSGLAERVSSQARPLKPSGST